MLHAKTDTHARNTVGVLVKTLGEGVSPASGWLGTGLGDLLGSGLSSSVLGVPGRLDSPPGGCCGGWPEMEPFSGTAFSCARVAAPSSKDERPGLAPCER